MPRAARPLSGLPLLVLSPPLIKSVFNPHATRIGKGSQAMTTPFKSPIQRTVTDDMSLQIYKEEGSVSNSFLTPPPPLSRPHPPSLARGADSSIDPYTQGSAFSKFEGISSDILYVSGGFFSPSIPLIGKGFGVSGTTERKRYLTGVFAH